MAQQTIQVEDLILPGPGQIQDVKRVSLATNDYAASSTGLPRLDRGFFLKSNTAGTFNVITLRAFRQKLFDKSSTAVAVADYKKISNSERNRILRAIKTDGNDETIYVEPGVFNDTHLVFVDKTNAEVDHVYIGVV